MVRRLGILVCTVALGLTLLTVAPAHAGSAREGTPAWAELVPARTTQVVRTVTSHRFCRQVWCTVTQAWERRDGRWTKLREFRSTIGARGWGKRREGDRRSPTGSTGSR